MAIAALKSGKNPEAGQSLDEARQLFESSAKQYFELLESITIRLRQEVRLLHQSSTQKVLPITTPAKADWIGRQKEEELWKTVDNLIQSMPTAD
jgi:hypothetical protein